MESTIGKVIREARRRKYITQSAMAKKIGVSRKSIEYWESGKRMPSGNLLLMLMEILEISAEDFKREARKSNAGILHQSLFIVMGLLKSINEAEIISRDGAAGESIGIVEQQIREICAVLEAKLVSKEQMIAHAQAIKEAATRVLSDNKELNEKVVEKLQELVARQDELLALLEEYEDQEAVSSERENQLTIKESWQRYKMMVGL